MKYLNTILIGVIAICLSLSSCKKDEDERESMFTFNDTDHITDHGYVAAIAASNTETAYYFYLCTSDMNVSMAARLSGYGDWVLVAFLSDAVDELLPGTYSYGSDMYGVLCLNYDEDIKEGIYYNLSSSGSTTAKVSVEGDIYEIEYTMTMETDRVLTGYFKGPCTTVSMTAFKSLTKSEWTAFE